MTIGQKRKERERSLVVVESVACWIVELQRSNQLAPRDFRFAYIRSFHKDQAFIHSHDITWRGIQSYNFRASLPCCGWCSWLPEHCTWRMNFWGASKAISAKKVLNLWMCVGVTPHPTSLFQKKLYIAAPNSHLCFFL